MGITPWSAGDGDDDLDFPASPALGEGLSVRSEFAGTDSVNRYANAALYGAGLATVTNTRPADDVSWVNKFWPTDPWVKDTEATTEANAALPPGGRVTTVNLCGGWRFESVQWTPISTDCRTPLR